MTQNDTCFIDAKSAYGTGMTQSFFQLPQFRYDDLPPVYGRVSGLYDRILNSDVVLILVFGNGQIKDGRVPVAAVPHVIVVFGENDLRGKQLHFTHVV